MHSTTSRSAGLPPAAEPVPIRQLEHDLLGLAGHLAAAQCRFLGLLAEFDRRDGWAGPGLRSCAHWLSWRIGMSLRTATEHVRVAHALSALPCVRAAFAAGRLSYSKVRAITRIARPETEQDLLDLALAGTAAHVERVVRTARQQAADPVVATARRSVTWHWDDLGMLVIRGRLAPAEGATLIAALETAAGQRDPLPDEPLDAQHADALHRLATAGRSRPTKVVLHIDERSGAARVADGPALPPTTAERMTCEAQVQLLLSGRSSALYLGRTRRLASAAQIAALRLRDGRQCRYPGCTHRRHLHAHHIRHWLHGGSTDLDNLVLLCSFHHARIHDHHHRVVRDHTGGLVFSRPDGTPIPPSGPPLEGDVERLLRAHERVGPRIDPEGLTPGWAGERLDLTPILARLLAAEPTNTLSAA